MTFSVKEEGARTKLREELEFLLTVYKSSSLHFLCWGVPSLLALLAPPSTYYSRNRWRGQGRPKKKKSIAGSLPTDPYPDRVMMGAILRVACLPRGGVHGALRAPCTPPLGAAPLSSPSLFEREGDERGRSICEIFFSILSK
uniref:Uncharacterized protein n=1 Tax=Morchella brunnea TaxID=1174671 RepID=A0A8K1I808_9PEZI|nr:hypothetical protein LK370_mgp044 [Morchella brunnea]UBU98586.1 hypothetical protein [Morchella brunnea]